MLYKIESTYTRDELEVFAEFSKQLVEEAKKNNWIHEKDTTFSGTDREKLLEVLSGDELKGIVVWTLDPAIVPDERKKSEFQLQGEIWFGKKKSASDVDFNLDIENIVPLNTELVVSEIIRLLNEN
ncbi:hypothetical protein CN918_26775 [Priestia megaterium]|nr:hypothetical protein CN918_26775 [Priestia megaterium]